MRRRSSTLRVKSLKAALHEFLSAPATGGYGINDGVVQKWRQYLTGPME